MWHNEAWIGVHAMTIKIFENFHTVQIILPKITILEWALTYPEAELEYIDHWFIYDHSGNLQEASVDRRDKDVLALANFAWRVHAMRQNAVA